MKHILISISVTLIFLFSCTSNKDQERPNILIIQCDHLTQRVVGVYGNKDGLTPAIDGIASRGVCFANAYVGSLICLPSRAALWTGMMPHQTKVLSSGRHHYNPEINDSIVKMADEDIQALIDALNSTSEAENTIIVITTDHGDGMASHRMVTKQVSFYDELTNVPFIISGKGITPNIEIVRDVLVSASLDLMLTLCELAGIDIPGHKGGISVVPVLKGGSMNQSHPFVASEWYSE